jgi:uncharacterized membrane protein YfcA
MLPKASSAQRLVLALAAAMLGTLLTLHFSPVEPAGFLFALLLLVFAILFVWPRPAASLRDAEQKQRWAEVRERGWRYFLIHHAILRLAVPVGLAMTLYSLFLEPVFFAGELPRLQELSGTPMLRSLLVALVIWPLVGYLWGVWVWRANEKRSLRGGT